MEPGVEKGIWAGLERSGISLELQVYEMISKAKGWTASPKQYYVDSDEGKGRELDLHAELSFDTREKYYNLNLHLIIECKKIPGNAWVFFPGGIDFGVVPSNDFLNAFRDWGRPAELLEPFDSRYIKGGGCRHYEEVVVDPNRSNKDKGKRQDSKDNIFEAVVTVTKATEYFRTKRVKEMKEFFAEFPAELLSGDRIDWRYWADTIEIYQPLIVFEGVLCKAILGPKKSLNEATHLRLFSDYRSAKYEISYLPIDVCVPSYLPTYLQTMETRLKEATRFAEGKDRPGTPWIETHMADVEEKFTDFRNRLPRPP